MRSLGRCILLSLPLALASCFYDWTVVPAADEPKPPSSSDCKENSQCKAGTYCSWDDGKCGTGAFVGTCIAKPSEAICNEKKLAPVCGCGLDPADKRDPCALAMSGIDTNESCK